MAIAPDEPKRLRELIEDGFKCDLLLITGGVSMGKYDLVEQVLAEMEAEFYFTGVRMQPGKPAVFGRRIWRGARVQQPMRSFAGGGARATLLLWVARESGFYDGDVPSCLRSR